MIAKNNVIYSRGEISFRASYPSGPVRLLHGGNKRKRFWPGETFLAAPFWAVVKISEHSNKTAK